MFQIELHLQYVNKANMRRDLGLLLVLKSLGVVEGAVLLKT